MTKSTLAYTNSAENLVLVEQMAALAAFGFTQRKIAEALSLSEGSLSRLRKGERRATARHVATLGDLIRELESERSAERKRVRKQAAPTSIFSLDNSVLEGMPPNEAVRAFRDLLWARATERGIPTTRISTTLNTDVPDGGVDAVVYPVFEATVGEDDLLNGLPRFQIKTGQATPWRPAWLKNELFGPNSVSFENLGPAIQEALKEGGRFVFVCFGVDPTDEQKRKARNNLRTHFAACGYPDSPVEVWGQADLVGLFNHYPSLCLQLLGHEQKGFRSRVSWSDADDMQPEAHYSPEELLLIEGIRGRIKSGEIGHLRLVGEPGVGKTRLAFEITGTEELAPVTLYVKDGRSFLESSFFNELLQVDDKRFVVLVIDECPPKDRADIWNLLKAKSSRLRIITIDHNLEEATDDKTLVHEVVPVGEDQIVAILRDHGVGENDAIRSASFCAGCPRVAHVIGDNLRNDRSSLLLSPMTVDVWSRFIVGRDDPQSEEVETRRRVLRYIALFERFGFEHPVQAEGEFIAKLAGIPWSRFQAIVTRLKQRRILQGDRTLYLTPRLLHIYLYNDFWNTEGRSFDIAAWLHDLPGGLWHWFVSMLRYSHESPQARDTIDRLLGAAGPFPSGSFADTEANGRLMMSLAEACPEPTLRCLDRTIGAMTREQLRLISNSRQSLVWTLERLAVWKSHFLKAATLLLRLAEAENATHSNKATGTFTELFSLIPGAAATEADHSTRMIVLRETLDSPSTETRCVALKACESALSTYGGMRFVGAEHQGLRRTIAFWLPQTYAELWDCYRDVWQALTAKLDQWRGNDRRLLLTTIVGAAPSLLHIESLAPQVMSTLRAVANDSELDIHAFVDMLQRQLRYGRRDTSDEIRRDLVTLCDGMEGNDFGTRLRRYVKHLTWQDSFDQEGKRNGLPDAKQQELADEAIHNPELLSGQLPWLVCENSGPAFYFGFLLSQRDRARTLMGTILSAYAHASECTSATFLGGYLHSMREQDFSEWEDTILELADNPVVAAHYSDFVIASGVSDRVVARVIEQCRSAKQSVGRLERWWSSTYLKELKPETVHELIGLQLSDGSAELWHNALQMAHTYFFDKDDAGPFPEELVFALLTSEAMAQRRGLMNASYYWSRLANAFLLQYPNRKWDFLRALLNAAATNASVLVDLNMNQENLPARLFHDDPNAAFSCVAEVYSQFNQSGRFGLQHWLADGGRGVIGSEGNGPIQLVPIETLFSWIDGDISRRGHWVARLLPKTFDKTPAGRMTRAFVVKYGANELLADSLHAHFRSRGWSGNASDMYRRLREEAREWLSDEKDGNAIRWLDEYISGLGYSIERAEMEEERRG